MKNPNHISTLEDLSDRAHRTSEARLRIGASPLVTVAPEGSAAATANIAAELLNHLTNEIANVMMTVQPSLMALDELAQNDPLLVEHANSVVLASGRLNRYVEDVNTLVGQPFDTGPTLPLPILEEFINERIFRDPLNARFMSQLALDLWEVAVCPNDIRTICRNLVDNAITATQRGGGVRIDSENVRQRDCATTELPEGEYLRIRVTDDGVGMSEAVLARAKEPFFTTWGRTAHWRGLGLTQVETICRRGGGRLHLRSSPGRGTVATALLRRAKGRGPSHKAGRFGQVDGAPLAASHFLMVDDEPLVLSSLFRGLTERGHRVELAQDPHTALAILKEGSPCSIAVIDLHLGHLSGLDLARDIATLRPDVRLILTSGLHAAGCPTLDSMPLPEMSFLPKPFDVEALLSLLTCEDAPRSKR